MASTPPAGVEAGPASTTMVRVTLAESRCVSGSLATSVMTFEPGTSFTTTEKWPCASAVMTGFSRSPSTVTREFGSVIDTLKRSIIGGRRLTEAMRSTGWFTPAFLNMVNVGEETGKLETMIARTAAILDREFDARMKRFLALLEPLLILMVGAIVGVILMALYLPMFGLARAVLH